jgi:hypothetical protein
MAKFNYFYKIENKINGNFYYGVHKTSNLNDGYLGSGKRIVYALEKYGRENFKKEILLFFNTYEEALNYESKIVTEQLISDPSCYNLAKGGKSDTGFLRQGPALINKETSEIIKPNNIKEYYELFNTGKYYGHTKNHAQFKNENGKLFYLDINDDKIKELNLHGVTFGKFVSKDKNGNTYIIDKNDERYLRGDLVGVWQNKKHTIETKIKMKNTFKIINHQQKEKNSQYGTCWITNEKESKKIYKGDLIPDGWKKGRKIKF